MNRFFKTCLAGLAALALSFSGLDAATELFRHQGEQFFDSNGDPLAGGKVYYYEAGTTTLQTTYSDADGTTPNSNPIVLDAAGRLTVPVYFGDSDSFSDYKEDLNTSADVAVSPWPFDNIPAAEPAATAAAFAPPLLSWTQVTSAASPVALTSANAGNAYEANTTSGSIEFDLPSAASVGDGKGFVFKKTASANSMVIDPSGSETIDDSSTSLTVTRQYQVVGIFSNGAEWYKAFEYLDDITSSRLSSTFISSLTAATSAADADEFLMQLAGGGAFRKIQGVNLPGWHLIESNSASSVATADIDVSGYDVVKVFLQAVPATDGVDVFLRMSNDGTTFLSGAGDYGYPSTTGTEIQFDVDVGVGNVSTEGISAELTLYRMQDTGNTKYVLANIAYRRGDGVFRDDIVSGGLLDNTDAVVELRFLFSSGNIASITWHSIGIIP